MFLNIGKDLFILIQVKFFFTLVYISKGTHGDENGRTIFSDPTLVNFIMNEGTAYEKKFVDDMETFLR